MNYGFKRWTTLIFSFLAGQGAVQLLNVISGFLLLRWLNVEAYAQYSVAFGFQTTLGMLVDLGFSGSIIALVGDRGSEKEVVGAYIRSAKYFRNRLFAVIIPLSVIAFPLVTSKQDWDAMTQLLLFISVIASLFFQGWAAYYSPPLLIHQQLKQYYQPQVVSAVGRMVLCFILYLISALTSWTTAWVNSAVFAVNGFLYRRSTTSLITEPRSSNPQINSEMIRYLSPLIPVAIYTAFQGQISLILITIFGRTESVAEVAALGRIGQLFFILTAFNSVIIAPRIAQVARRDLAKKYFQTFGVALTFAAILSFIAFLFPQPLLWLLGSKYQNLRSAIVWVVLSSSFAYLANVLNTMNMSRKWIYWWSSVFEISLIVIVQLICMTVMDLSTTIQVIYFSLIVTAAYTALHFLIGIYGLIHNYHLHSEVNK